MRSLALAGLSFFLAASPDHAPTPLRAPVIESLIKAAPDFTYRSLDGKPHHLRDLRGKTVVLDFWGTWCVGCVEEMPKFQQLYESFRNDPNVVFVMVAQNDTLEKVKAFAQKNKLSIPLSYADATPPAGVLATEAWPSTYFISPDGIVRGVYRGGADWSDPSVKGYVERLKTHSSVGRS